MELFSVLISHVKFYYFILSKKMLIFTRTRKKGILKNDGNQLMTMPLWVWNVLVRNANVGIDIKK